jgi:hypothetical protein
MRATPERVIAPIDAPLLGPEFRDPAVELHLRGEDLVVEGRFDHWMPVSMESTEAEQGALQLLFDVTGVAPANANAPTDQLLSFTSGAVERVANGALVAAGVLRHGLDEVHAQALIQTPTAHTPFVAITLSFDRERMSELWDRFSALLAARSRDAQLMPRAWPKEPMLAAA